MGKYHKKPVVVEAVQLRWDTWDEMCTFAGVGKLTDGKPEGATREGGRIALNIPTSEGLVVAEQDDWVIKDEKGELDSCKPDIFGATYEKVEE